MGGEKEISELTEEEIRSLFELQPKLDDGAKEELLQRIEQLNLSSAKTRGLKLLLNDLGKSDENFKKKAPKKPRKQTQKELHIIFENEESEYSDFEELDIDKRFKHKPFSLTPFVNRSHVPTKEDKLEKIPITGLHHSDTFLTPLQGGQFVPRTINGIPNKDAHPKKMPEDQLTELANIAFDDEELDLEKKAKAKEKLVEMQKQLYFGSAIDWSKDEYDEEMVKNQESRRKKLSEEESLVGGLMSRNATKGLTSGSKEQTSKHSEQKLLSSVVWKGMLMKIMKLLDKQGKDVVLGHHLHDVGIQLILNRSSCLGCAKALVLALVDFWDAVASVVGFKSWREAKDYYDHLNLFSIEFPVIYEYNIEKKGGKQFANIESILNGLVDAGWRIHAPTGIESNEHSKENHEELKKLIGKTQKDKKQQSLELKPERGINPLAIIDMEFHIGRASGSGNNCLLNTLYQLANNTTDENENLVDEMRDVLNTLGMAENSEMIDLYGGTGQQLAQEFNIRIQAYEIHGGNIIVHPILGTGGPVVRLLHAGHHFVPLWERDVPLDLEDIIQQFEDIEEENDNSDKVEKKGNE